MTHDASHAFPGACWVHPGSTPHLTRDVLWDRPVFHAPPLIAPRLNGSIEPFARQPFWAPAGRSRRLPAADGGQQFG